MKTTAKKIVSALCSALLIGAALAPSAFALDFFSSLTDILGDDLNNILDGLMNGNNGGDETQGNSSVSLNDLFSNPGGILDALRQRLANYDIDVSNSSIANALASILTNEDGMDLSSLLNSNELLAKLITYFREADDQTDPTEESTTQPETTTEPPTTEPPTTLPPATTAPAPSYYIPVSQSTTEAPTESTTEPEYSYVEPSVKYTEELSTVPFSPVYEEDYSDSQEGVSPKMIVGIVILALSLVAVVVVGVVLKKTKV
ncbi:MAG: hypothetical protein IJS90_04085 [Clostridia bacterium]|nr:hypothetical protein [Clostridia bacterium]